MIAALILFDTRGSLSLDEAAQRFNTTAPNYRGREGLRSKAYIYAQDGADLGGFYLWASREAAEAVYTDAWKAKATEIYGTPPVIRYFDVPVYIDN
ncbi:MAG TPA: hypothetical protein VMM78_05445 [Thermomicrobiales bacterium]|nr:hypothetical protein [Thermomicrobiales bacterium]